MAEYNSDTAERSIDIYDMSRVIRKHFRLILTVFFTMVLTTTVLSFLIPPIFEAVTTLRIKQPKSLDNSLLANAPNLETQKLLSTYVEIIRSRTVIDTVIAKTQHPKVTFEKMLNKITVEPVRDTEILKVKVRDNSAQKAMLIANTLVDTFLLRLTKLVRSEESAVGNYIDECLVGAKQELDQSEKSLEEFKSEHQITAPEDETKALLERLSSMNQLKAENKITLAAAQAKLEAAQKELSQGNDEKIAASPLIGQYKDQLTNLEVELVGLLRNLGENDPKAVATRDEIEEVKTKLNTEISKAVNSEKSALDPIHQNLLQGKLQANFDIAAAKAQKVALDQITATAEKEISKLPAREQELIRLMRNASLAQEIYVMLTKRREEAKISEIMKPTDVQIIDLAVLPEKPVIPNKKLNVLLAGFLGLFAGAGLAFWRDYLNTTIDTADDVKNYLDLPVLGNIPDFKRESEASGCLFKVK